MVLVPAPPCPPAPPMPMSIPEGAGAHQSHRHRRLVPAPPCPPAPPMPMSIPEGAGAHQSHRHRRLVRAPPAAPEPPEPRPAGPHRPPEQQGSPGLPHPGPTSCAGTAGTPARRTPPATGTAGQPRPAPPGCGAGWAELGPPARCAGARWWPVTRADRAALAMRSWVGRAWPARPVRRCQVVACDAGGSSGVGHAGVPTWSTGVTQGTHQDGESSGWLSVQLKAPIWSSNLVNWRDAGYTPRWRVFGLAIGAAQGSNLEFAPSATRAGVQGRTRMAGRWAMTG